MRVADRTRKGELNEPDPFVSFVSLLLAPLGEGDEPGMISVDILHRVGDTPVTVGVNTAGTNAVASGTSVAMTCSIGWEIATLADGASIREALRRADLDLYAAKQAGRDRAQGPGGVVGLLQRR